MTCSAVGMESCRYPAVAVTTTTRSVATASVATASSRRRAAVAALLPAARFETIEGVGVEDSVTLPLAGDLNVIACANAVQITIRRHQHGHDLVRDLVVDPHRVARELDALHRAAHNGAGIITIGAVAIVAVAIVGPLDHYRRRRIRVVPRIVNVVVAEGIVERVE